MKLLIRRQSRQITNRKPFNQGATQIKLLSTTLKYLIVNNKTHSAENLNDTAKLLKWGVFVCVPVTCPIPVPLTSPGDAL